MAQTAIYLPKWFPASCLQQSHFPDIHAPFKDTYPLGKIFQWLVIPWGRIHWGSLYDIDFWPVSDKGKAQIWILILIYKNKIFSN